MSDPGLLLVAELHGLAGRSGELHALVGQLARDARTEDGCTAFRAFADDDPGEFLILSAWRDEAALRAHYAGPAYRRYRMAVGELLARPSDVVVHHVVQTVHAADPNPPDPGLLG